MCRARVYAVEHRVIISQDHCRQGVARRRTVDDDAMMEVWSWHLSASIMLSLLQNCTAMN